MMVISLKMVSFISDINCCFVDTREYFKELKEKNESSFNPFFLGVSSSNIINLMTFFVLHLKHSLQISINLFILFPVILMLQ